MKQLSIVLPFGLLLAACTATGGGSRSGRGGESAGDQQTFHLYAVEIDKAAVKNGAQLLFDGPPPGVEFGLERRAQGVFRVSTNGFVDCTVRVAEPVIGLGGRRSEHRYTLLDFNGKAASDGESATISGGEAVAIESSYRPASILFRERGDDRLTIQPVAGGKPGAYLFHVQRQGFAAANVQFPWK
jgi:hypothetical protein